MRSIIVDDDEVSRKIISRFVEQTDFLDLVQTCSDGIEAGNVLRNEDVDLVFLDIEMPEMDGIELIESLKEPPQFILITSKEQYAIKAFEYAVTDYLLKPISYARFLKASQRALENYKALTNSSGSTKSEGQNLFVKVNSQLVKINIYDILWIEAKGDYINITTPEKVYTVHSTMKGFEKKLNNSHLMRAHRSFIVNTHKIKLIDEGMLVIEDKLIPIGPNYKKKLMLTLNKLHS